MIRTRVRTAYATSGKWSAPSCPGRAADSCWRFTRVSPPSILGSGRVDLWPRPPEHDPAVVRFNDGKCDPSGRFWAGTMALVKGPRPLGRLYRLDADGAVEVMLRDVGTSNGVAWSADRRTLYFIDTPLLRVDAFDYDDATGAIANRRTVISIPPGIGRPDGSTLDADGMLWIAMYEGWAVTRWNPRTGRTPADHPASGGTRHFLCLRRTGARHALSHVGPAQPRRRTAGRTAAGGKPLPGEAGNPRCAGVRVCRVRASLGALLTAAGSTWVRSLAFAATILSPVAVSYLRPVDTSCLSPVAASASERKWPRKMEVSSSRVIRPPSKNLWLGGGDPA